MTSPVRVRAVAAAEYDAVGRLTVTAYRDSGQLSTGDYEAELRDVAARVDAGEVLVAVDGRSDDLLGTVTFVLPGTAYSELSRPGEAEFRMLAVDPAAQGKGVGEALVRACIDLASRQGLRALVLYTRDVAVNAQRLYQRLGFVRTPELDWTPVPAVALLAMRLDLPGRSPAGG
jgi:ribosomal protein S18 acetylase RimI-like enzyme